MQWTVDANGLPNRMLVISKLQLDEPLREADLGISSTMRNSFQAHAQAKTGPAALTFPGKANTVAEPAPGVVLFSGFWNVAFIDQGDGIVILECPISSSYSNDPFQRMPDGTYPSRRP